MDNELFHHNWAMDVQSTGGHFDSSMTSSPVTSNPNLFNDSFVLRELIGKLANIGDSVSPQSHHSHPLLGNLNPSSMATTGLYTSGNNSANTSCYNTPLNSPPKVTLNSSLMNLSGDPGFAERAARLSSFGSRSFNDRTSQNHQYSVNGDSGFGYGSNAHLMGRVASSPSLKSLKTKSSIMQDSDSPVSIEFPSDLNSSRKRKAKSIKVVEGESDSIAKRRKIIQSDGNENVKSEEEQKGNSGADSEVQEQTKNNKKPIEPLKDYIHVRARRGQATDSHSLAERVRREKIGERMKLLQDLVPGCNKVTGKALMLDEIINYVQSLQHQVEFLSMKLASVDFRTELNMESHPSNQHFSGTMDMLDTVKCQNLSMHLPHIDGFGHGISPFQALGEDDLQSLVQMGLARI